MQSTPLPTPRAAPAPADDPGLELQAVEAAHAAVRASLPRTLAERSAMRPIDLIVIHCSATRSGAPVAFAAETAIDGWHKARGFARLPRAAARLNPHLAHIGYHYVIDLDGRIATGRGLPEPGAHVAGFNARSVGICMVGGAEPVARYTLAQWRALRTLVARLKGELDALARSQVRVCGHRGLSPDTNGDGQVTSREWLKTCPGFDVAAWLQAGMQPLAMNVLEGGAA